ncbi:DUF6134 family protein [Spirosoma litoris]
MKKSLLVLFFLVYGSCSLAQTTADTPPAETHHYAIEIAGIRVGTMTAVRQSQPDNQTIYTLISDVKVNLLVYTVKIYYKVINRFEGKKLMFSTVDVRTNRGEYTSKTEWKGDHYDIVADQYKYKRQTTEMQNIDFSSSLLYFYEPVGRNKVYAEYFGDYFTFNKTAAGTYHATVSDREDDYIYQNGRLVKIVKHNSLKNFVVRLLD